MSTSLGNTSLNAGINKTSSKVRPSPNKREFADLVFGEIILVAIGKDNGKQVSRDKGQGARDKGQGTRNKKQGARDKGQETRNKGQGARDKGQETRDKGQGTRYKEQGICSYNNL